MSKFVIITDSCSELNRELRTKYDIEYIPMHFRLDDVEYDANLDWEEVSPKQLYDSLREGKRVTTAQITKEESEWFIKILNGEEQPYPVEDYYLPIKMIDIIEKSYVNGEKIPF